MFEVEADRPGEHGRLDVAAGGDHIGFRHGVIDAADVLLVAGTSLAVFSGYRFLRRAVERNIPVAIVNRGPVRGEEHATVRIDGATGEILSAVAAALDVAPAAHLLA